MESRQHLWSAAGGKLVIDLECLYHHKDDHPLRSVDVMMQRTYLRLFVAIDPGFAGFAGAVEGLARSLNAAVVDAEPEFVAQLVGSPIWLGFGSDTVAERYLITKEIHCHGSTRLLVVFMLGSPSKNPPEENARRHEYCGETYDRSRDAAGGGPPIVCAKLVAPAPVCLGCVDGNAETPFGTPNPQLGPLPK